MSLILNFQYVFHPVGQGLFASGAIWSEYRPAFKWVYDCGTSSKHALVKNAVENYSSFVHNEAESNNTIDLLVLSHFDHDHISGVVDILSRFQVKVLMLPYLSLAERLWVAFIEGISIDAEEMDFFRNPVIYLAARSRDDGIGEIVFVPANSAEPLDDRRGEVREPSGEPGSELYLDIDREQEPNDAEYSDFAALRDAGGVKGRNIGVSILRRGGGAQILNVWEFAPYNDAQLASLATPKFAAIVQKEAKKLLSCDVGTNDTLGALKKIYSTTFGGSGNRRNEVSLFVYAGPLDPNQIVFMSASFNASRGPHGLNFQKTYSQALISTPAAAILYTGDGYLNTSGRMSRLIAAIGAARIARLACLQVMHHGSRHSWHTGLADQLKPWISVFSADPNDGRYLHPHAEVVRDFLLYMPVLVDKARHCEVKGEFWGGV